MWKVKADSSFELSVNTTDYTGSHPGRRKFV